MTIEEMAVKSESDSSLHLPSYVDDQLTDEQEELARVLPHLTNEEQGAAALSTGFWRNRKRQSRKNTPQLGRNRTLKEIRESLRSLSVEFNVNRPAPLNVVKPAENATTNGTPKDNVTIERLQEWAPPQVALLNWTKEDRNTLLGAFFMGYVIFQIPAGRAAELFGAKLLFLCLALGTGVGSLIFPLACRSVDGIWLPYVVRFVLGASQAGLFPAVYVLLCQWLPKKERSSWLAVPSAMGRIGTIVMNLLVPFVMKTYGWEMVFYASGCITLLWGALFVIFGSDSPATSNWISDKELMFIEARMEPRVGQLSRQTSVTGSGFTINEASPESPDARKPAISWWKLISNRALLIMTLVMFTSEWSNMLLLVKLPGFLGPALKMDLDEIGMWSSALVGVYCVQYPLSGVLASRLEAAELDGWHSLRVRKLFEAAAHILQALGCLVIALTSDRTIVLISLFTIMLGRSTVGGGQCLMPPELSKDYPGTVMAVANSIANSAGIVGPMIVTWLVDDPWNYDSWRSLWLLSAGVFTAGGAIFCLLADNEPQNYCKKPKRLRPGTAISQAQLFPASQRQVSLNPGGRRGDVEAAPEEPVEEEQVARMGAFSRLGSEPPPSRRLPNDTRQPSA